jgi:hypothetical protein
LLICIWSLLGAWRCTTWINRQTRILTVCQSYLTWRERKGRKRAACMRQRLAGMRMILQKTCVRTW